MNRAITGWSALGFALAGTLALGGAALQAGPAPQQAQTPPPARDTRAPGQPANTPAASGVIGGTVSSADLSAPVRRVRVSISGGDQRVSKSTLTDDQGRFSFTALGPGEYTLTASKPGYLNTTYGQKLPGTDRPGTTIRLAASQHLDKISMPIVRGSVITGVVRDDGGEPSYGTTVSAYRYVMKSGERTLVSAGSAQTDDRGVYRIPILIPGEYIVRATPRMDAEGQVLDVMKMRVEEMAAVARASGNDKLMVDAKMAMADAQMQQSMMPTSGYAPVYFPGTTQASGATPFMLSTGEERGGIDLQLQLVPTGSISGGIVTPDGTLPVTQIQLIDPTQPPGLGFKSARSAPDGRFTFSGVPPGRYTILAKTSGQVIMRTMTEAGGTFTTFMATEKPAAPGGQPPPQLWGMADVVSDGRDVQNVVLQLQQGLTVSGSVVFESGATPPNMQTLKMSVTVAPASGNLGELMVAPPAPVDENGRFTIRGLMPGFYRIVPSAGVPGPFQIKSSVFNGRDSLDFPLEIKPSDNPAGGVLTFGTKTTELTGVLQDGAGQPAPGYTLIAFAADESYWVPQSRRIAAVRPATDGRYSFRLPPGDYRLVAVTDVEPGQWFDPAFLRQLIGAAMPITLAEGESKVQAVRVK